MEPQRDYWSLVRAYFKGEGLGKPMTRPSANGRERKVHWFEAFDRDPRTPTLCHTVRRGPNPPLTTQVGHRVTCRACRYLLALPMPDVRSVA